MSFLEYKDKINEGDTVILYLGASSMHSIVVNPPKVHQTKYGAFPHEEMIGRRFGSKMFSRNKKGWIHLLHPTSELWTLTLPHRTQILYSTDISMVIMQLEIKPGSIVIESGTGSASMSHALIRAVAPAGHLYTFEFHEDRCRKAKEEFREHKVDHLVTIQHRDILQDGFQLENIADAVFLDLPCPWSAIATSKKVINKNKGGHLCSFSPCIEQVQRTCETMAEHGFKDIEVMECLLKSYDVKSLTMNVPEFFEILQQGEPADDNKQKESITVDSRKPVSSNDDKNDYTKSSNILKLNKRTIMTAKPVKEMPGHTGFLTFGSLYPNGMS